MEADVEHIDTTLTDIKQDMREMRCGIGDLRTETKESDNSLRNEMKNDIGGLRTEMKEGDNSLRGEMQLLRSDISSNLKWSIGTTITIFSILAAMMAKGFHWF